MKKVYLFPAIAVMAAMTACTKEPVNTTVPEDELVPVQFGLASPDYSVTTKSTGGMDQWNNTTLYVYGFDRSEADYSTPFINNVAATAASTASISLTVTHQDTQNPYYYVEGVNYDFYGYHIDDAATPEAATPTPITVGDEGADQNGTQLTKGIYIPFSINGSQDLMTAKADPAVDILGTELEDVGTDRVYSAYAARRDVHPTLTFKHQLSRFIFQIKSGAESGNTVQVTGISIKDQKAAGYLQVVGDQLGITADANDEGTTVFYLMQKNVSTGVIESLTPTAPTNEFAEGKTNQPNQVGESIMIFPGQSSIEVSIATNDPNIENYDIPAQDFTINASEVILNDEELGDGATFEAGKKYTITIVIYGPEKIDITAELTGWVNGGEIEWDPDK